MENVKDLDRGDQLTTEVLLHVCCGPCSLICVRSLAERGVNSLGMFYNPNIHPQEEYLARRESMAVAARYLDLPMIWEPDHAAATVVEPEVWLRDLGAATAFGQRCALCYEQRLERVAAKAAELGLSAISTSLLYSRYQNHAKIVEVGASCAARHGLYFAYSDFRRYWQEGIELSKQIGLYRQKWCGCLLSKAEAEQQQAAKRLRREAVAARLDDNTPAG